MKTFSILSTTSLPDILSEIEYPNNFEIDEVDLIETKSCIDEKQALVIQKLFNQQITVIFTSKNAVEAVGNLLGAASANWNIFCLKLKTAELVKKYYPSALIKGTAHNAEALGALIVKENISEKLYFFCGNMRRQELPLALKNAKIEIEEIVVYNTRVLERAIEKKYDGIMFYSPSGVESFFAANRLTEEIVVFVIGEITAAAASGRCNNKIIVANVSSKQALIQTSIDYFKNKQGI